MSATVVVQPGELTVFNMSTALPPICWNCFHERHIADLRFRWSDSNLGLHSPRSTIWPLSFCWGILQQGKISRITPKVHHLPICSLSLFLSLFYNNYASRCFHNLIQSISINRKVLRRASEWVVSSQQTEFVSSATLPLLWEHPLLGVCCLYFMPSTLPSSIH